MGSDVEELSFLFSSSQTLNLECGFRGEKMRAFPLLGSAKIEILAAEAGEISEISKKNPEIAAEGISIIEAGGGGSSPWRESGNDRPTTPTVAVKETATEGGVYDSDREA